MRLKRWLKKGAITLAALGVILGLQVFSGVFASNTNPIFNKDIDFAEKVAHFNGIIFNNYTSINADVEGALAIGSRSDSTKAYIGMEGYFDIGASYRFQSTSQIGKYTNSRGFPTLLIDNEYIKVGNEDLSKNTNLAVHGPSPQIVMSQSTQNRYDKLSQKFTQGTVSPASDELVQGWFGDAYELMTRLGQQYEQAGLETDAGKIAWDDYMKIDNSTPASKYVNKTLKDKGIVDDKILVLTISTGQNLEIGNRQKKDKLHVPYSWLNKYEAIVFCFPDAINVNGVSPIPHIDGLTDNRIIDWNYPPYWMDSNYGKAYTEARQAMGEKVVYSFPNATNIHLQSAFICGSVIAPEAVVEASGTGGSINGQLVADSFYQAANMELHSLQINRKVYDVVEDEDPTPTADLSIWKYDEAGDITLKGAKFVLVKKEGNTESYFNGTEFIAQNGPDYDAGIIHEVNKNGRLEIKNVPVGNYIVREIEAPSGYELNDTDSADKKTYFEHEIEIKEEDKNTTVYVRRYNKKLGADIAFSKVDSEDNTTPLAGAVFGLYKRNGANDILIETTTSDNAGSFGFTGLEIGDYYVKELSAPSGYNVSSTEYNFTVTQEDGANELKIFKGEGMEELPGEPFAIPNTGGSTEHWLHILKQDDISEVGLQGAEFKLYKAMEDGVTITGWQEIPDDGAGNSAPWTTDEAGYIRIKKLDNGKYRLVETKAPDGYEKSEGKKDSDFPQGYHAEFNINWEQDGYLIEVVVENKKKDDLLADLIIYKVGESLIFSGQIVPLEGVRFGLYKLDEQENDKELILDNQRATDADGQIKIANLTAGKYRLWESMIDPTPGYEKLEGNLYFTVAFDSEGKVKIEDVQYRNGNTVIDLPDEENRVPVKITGTGDTFTIQIENTLKKADVILYKRDAKVYQEGVDGSGNEKLIYTYLEGAVFRVYRGDTQNSTPNIYKVVETKFINEFDDYGNQLAAAELGALPPGYYHVYETAAPDGYVLPTGKVLTFQITEKMTEEDLAFGYTIINTIDAPSGDLAVNKIDNHGEPVEHKIPFKLWEISGSAEYWDDTITLEEALSGIQEGTVEFNKFYNKENGSSSFWTDTEGVLNLKDITPGVYVLFETVDTTDEEFLQKYVYMLNDGKDITIADIEDFEAEFYYHATLFKVVADDEEKSVKIDWVDRHKLWSGQAVFSAEDATNLKIINKLQEDLDVTLEFEKKDAEDDTYLEGAVFELYKKKNGTDAANGNLDDYETEPVSRVTSANGRVKFDPVSVDFEWVGDPANHLMFTRYMIRESAAPEGYVLSEDEIYLRLVLNPETKMIDVYRENPNGELFQGVIQKAGYNPGESDKKEMMTEWFTTTFDISDMIEGLFANYKETTPTGDVTIRKVDENDHDKTLGNATFRLQVWSEEVNDYVSYNGPFTTTVADGIVVIRQLPAGKYKLRETSAATGYELSDKVVEFELQYDEASGQMKLISDNKWVNPDNLQIEFENESIAPLKIILFKTDASGEDVKKLEGAIFQLKIWDDAKSTYVNYGEQQITGSDGLVRWDELYEGSYRAYEVQAPEGYSLPVGNSNYISFEVKKAEGGKSLEMYIPNIQVLPDPNAVTIIEGDKVRDYNYAEGYDVLAIVRNKEYADPYGNIVVQKYDEEKNILTGAKFRLQMNKYGIWIDIGVERVIGDSGMITWGGLNPGDYRIIETSAPEGYQTPTLSEAATFTLVIDPERSRTVIVEDFVPGFMNEEVAIVIDDTDLEAAHNKITFTAVNKRKDDGEIDEPSGAIVIGKESAEENEKEEDGRGTPLAGTTFALWKCTMEDISLEEIDREWAENVDAEYWAAYPDPDSNHFVTEADGKKRIDGLTTGVYKIDEIIPPEGYALYGDAKDTHYFIMDADANGTVRAYDINTHGPLITGGDNDGSLGLRFADLRLAPLDVEVIKTDAVSGVGLAGAEFELYMYDKENDKYSKLETGSLKTDKDGKLKLEQLPYGSYKLVETEAPEGYLKPEGEMAETYFELGPNSSYTGMVLLWNGQESEHIPVTNISKDAVGILKVNKDNHQIRLAGAEFILEKLLQEPEEEPVDNDGDTGDDSGGADDNGSSEEGDPSLIQPFADTDEEINDAGSEGETDTSAAEVTQNQPVVVEEPLEEVWEPVEGYEAVKTEADGKAYLQRLEAGTYRLTETKTPKGYLLESPVVVVFKVTEDGVLEEIISGAKAEEGYLLIENKAEEKPEPDPEPEPTPTPPPADGEPKIDMKKKGESPETGVKDLSVKFTLLFVACLMFFTWMYRRRRHGEAER